MKNVSAVDYKDCTGCTSCASLCPKKAIILRTDKKGFYVPIIDSNKCIECGICLAKCPTRRLVKRNNESATLVYAVSLKDGNIKKNSSSGGAFYWLAQQFLKDGGIVYGAAFCQENKRVEHIRLNDIKDLKKLQNSKYVQSWLGDTLTNIRIDLQNNERVLFSGTPCQVAAVYSSVGEKVDNLFTCDILCYGVPSPLAFESYLTEKEQSMDKKIVDINMRDKTHGWQKYSMKLVFNDHQCLIESKNTDLYHLGFQSHLLYRESCFTCKFRSKNRIGDITLGDFWNYKESFKRNSIINNDTGISYVRINNEKGNRLFDTLDKTVVYIEQRVQNDNSDNFGFGVKMEIPDQREEFFCMLRENGYREAISRYVTPIVNKKVNPALRTYRKLKEYYWFRKVLHRFGIDT